MPNGVRAGWGSYNTSIRYEVERLNLVRADAISVYVKTFGMMLRAGRCAFDIKTGEINL